MTRRLGRRRSRKMLAANAALCGASNRRCSPPAFPVVLATIFTSLPSARRARSLGPRESRALAAQRARADQFIQTVDDAVQHAKSALHRLWRAQVHASQAEGIEWEDRVA